VQTEAARPPVQVIPTRFAETLAWIRSDVPFRLLPFGLAYAIVLLWQRNPLWLGWSAGRLELQLAIGLLGAPLLFVPAMAVQLWLSRRRGALRVPAGPAPAAFEAGYYVLNGPLEEAFFRGLVQGGGSIWLGPLAGFLVGTLAYVLYHRLGRWPWPDVAATALVGVPLGLAFWLLPGPPSLLGISIAHIGATCGFLGPGPYLLKRLGLLG
jgi:membrane protease YdiL (CAAX protease family)